MTRAEKATQARRLRDSGLKHREIAERMGVARTTVSSWLNDPDGSRLRARKDSYRGECVSCGAATDGSNGPDAAPEHCARCAPAQRVKWTRATVIAAIRDWAERNGEQPVAAEWAWAVPGYPATRTVQRVFDTWSAAIEAAGFVPRGRGEQRHRSSRELRSAA